MPLLIPIMPEGAIIRPSDPEAARPAKSRISGVELPVVSLDYPAGMGAMATWRFLIPRQSRMGALASNNLTVEVRYSSPSVATGNVQWQIEAALLDLEDPYDDPTTAIFTAVDVSTSLAYTGIAKDEQQNPVTLADLFLGIDTSKDYTLLLRIIRAAPSGDLAGTVSLLPSYIHIDTTLYAPSGVLVYENPRRSDSAIWTPAAYWPFTEAAGTNIADGGHRGNDLTLNAPYTWLTVGAPDGQSSLQIEPSFLTAYMDLGKSQDFNLTLSPSGFIANMGWTAFFRLKCGTMTAAGHPFIFRKSPDNLTFDAGSWYVAILGTSAGAEVGRVNFEQFGGSPNYAGARIDDGGWHDIVIILDRTLVGAHLRIYQDGVLENTVATLSPSADQATARIHIENASAIDAVEISEIAFLPFAVADTLPALLWNGGAGDQLRFNVAGLVEIAKV